MISDREKILGLETRRKLYEEIQRSPGAHFRELQRRSGMAVGALQYHLDVLEKAHLIKGEKKGKFVRYFPPFTGPTEDERETLSLLRQESVRKIVLYLLDKGHATNKELSAFLELSPSTISFHLQKLSSAGLVDKDNVNNKAVFVLTQPEQARNLFREYRGSFLDRMVDEFVAVWDELAIPEEKEASAETSESQPAPSQDSSAA